MISNHNNRPQKPKFPRWANICGGIALFTILFCRQFLNFEVFESLLISSAPAIAWFVGCHLQYKAEKAYEISDLKWKISNLQGWILYYEKNLKEGKPWFDYEDHDEWIFNNKYHVRKIQEELEELQNVLDKKLNS